MKRFLRGLFSRRPLPQRGADTFVSPDWTPLHQETLGQFLQSETGRVLLARGKSVLHETAVSACHDTFHTAHSAGRAAGFSDAIRWLESLSRSSRVLDDSMREQNANFDTAPTGESELRELLSP